MTNNPWIPHKPGDPMPVDGDTVVEVMTRDGVAGSRMACNWSWCEIPSWKFSEITAYRIHKPDNETGYSREAIERMAEHIKPHVTLYTGDPSKMVAFGGGGTGEQQKEKDVKYKAGDKVTIVLNEQDAEAMNEPARSSNLFNLSQIIAHEPAPEPLTGYINVFHDTLGWTNLRPSDGSWTNGKPSLKLTYNPATKQASVEVVG